MSLLSAGSRPGGLSLSHGHPRPPEGRQWTPVTGPCHTRSRDRRGTVKGRLYPGSTTHPPRRSSPPHTDRPPYLCFDVRPRHPRPPREVDPPCLESTSQRPFHLLPPGVKGIQKSYPSSRDRDSLRTVQRRGPENSVPPPTTDVPQRLVSEPSGLGEGDTGTTHYQSVKYIGKLQRRGVRWITLSVRMRVPPTLYAYSVPFPDRVHPFLRQQN